ncbi:MAG TPA: flavodoxin family protein, partial [Rhodanobacteraceae bacterium]|nr:flavodoxin family protein [Rhodanobacteraceae bacterium]
QPAALTSLRYALLVLGDRGYTHFCGFGRRLDRWLTQSGARAAFPRIEVDDENAAALERWYQAVRNWHAGPGVAVNNRDEAHAP